MRISEKIKLTVKNSIKSGYIFLVNEVIMIMIKEIALNKIPNINKAPNLASIILVLLIGLLVKINIVPDFISSEIKGAAETPMINGKTNPYV